MKIIHIHRYLSGEATPEEKEVLESWLERTEENQNLFESYRKIYDVKIRYKYKYDTEEALSRFRQVMHESVKEDIFFSTGTSRISHPRKSQAGLWWKAAAIVLIAVGLSVYLFISEINLVDDVYLEEDIGTSLSTALGEKKSFNLQDGSKVKLNADSELFIPADFGEEHRQVQLAGEAFFEIAFNEDLGFVVQSSTARVQVLGTSFGIRAWKERTETVVAVQTGQVSVRSVNPSIHEATFLKDGEISIVEINKAPTPAGKANISQYVGWTNQQFVFDDTPLKDVLKQLELHFNVTITVDDSTTMEDPVTSGYRNESLDEILEYTSITHGVNFKVEQP